MSTSIKSGNIFLRMHPLQRILVSAFMAGIVFFIVKSQINNFLLIIIATWGAFTLCYNIICWVVMFTRKLHDIKSTAKKEDGSRGFVLIFTIIAAFAAMFTVLLMVISSNSQAESKMLTLPLCIFSVMLSWALVHTILTFHYAHLYYDDDIVQEQKEGLNFPNEDEPDYLDFAYFSFVIGMTFQVSDVQVTDKKMRRLVLLHGLISFLLNTFVVALSINFIAGLSK